MQEHQSPLSTQTPSRNEAPPPSKTAKAEKNLYEPYVTPAWFWFCLRAFARTVFFLILSVKIKGRENLPKKGPYIIAANHLSWTDIPLVPAYMSEQVVYIAKEELFEGKLGWLVRFLGAIPVKRGEGDRQLIRASDELLKRGKILVIFPEGTRSKTREMQQAHAGLGMIALRAGVPVIPVAITGSEFAFKKFRPRVTVTYGTPIVLKPKGSKVTKEDISDGTAHIMRTIALILPETYRGVYGEQAVPTSSELL